MYNYSLFQWMMFFFVYCFFGWCIESTIVSISKRQPVNRGFLRIPMLPLYGTGAVLILFLTIPVRENIIAVYLVGLIGATVLEYITGMIMESLFKMKYWDYSHHRFQLHGRICLTSSLFWGVLSVALMESIHPPIEHWILSLNQTVVSVGVCITACLMFTDTIVSARAALDLAKVLEHLSAAREEIERLGLQLDELREAAQQQIEDIREGKDKLKEHMEEMKKQLSELSTARESEIAHLGFFKSGLLKGHPTAYSKKFNLTLRELKERMYTKKR